MILKAIIESDDEESLHKFYFIGNDEEDHIEEDLQLTFKEFY